MKLKELQEIEANIDACILAHDEAIRMKDKKMELSAIEVMQYELNKLEENTVHIKTPLS